MSDPTVFEQARRNEPLLNSRQREILDLLVAGKTNGEIGELLGMTLDGAKWNVSEILGKLGLDSREEAAEYWRWRRKPAGRLAALRGLFGLGALKWAGAGAAIIAGVAVLASLFGSPEEEQQTSSLPPFYLEGRMEIVDYSRTIGASPSGGPLPPPEHRIAEVRWWQKDFDHMRVEIETHEPANRAGTDVILVGRGKQVYYRNETNVYTETPLVDFPAEAKLRVRPWNFSTFVGPWMTEVESLDALLAQLREFGSGGAGQPPTVEVIGHEQLLGVDTAVVEYAPASRSSDQDGKEIARGTIRYWIDPERMVILRQVTADAGAQDLTIEVTRLDWDTRIDDDRFVFKPPKDARQVQEDASSPPGGSSGGSSVTTSGGSPGSTMLIPPAGMLRLAAAPDGFTSGYVESGYDAANRPTGHLVVFEHADGRSFVIDQRIRSGGPASPFAGREVATGSRKVYVTESAGEIAVSWADGDLIVRVASSSMTELDLLAIAESLQPFP